MVEEHSPVVSSDVVVVGIPFDAHSSFLRGSAGAPARIRETLHSGSSNWCAENGMNLQQQTGWRDIGDLALGGESDAYGRIEPEVASLLAAHPRLFALGGDHSITYPLLRAYARRYPGLGLLHVDAHPDLYDEFDGNRYSHACPFARIMEEHLVSRLVQVGIRTLNPQQREQAARFGVEVIEIKDWNPAKLPAFDGPFYLSLDMDALDPAFAPGVSHHEPGGLTTRDVLGLIQNTPGTLVGADLVEFNPSRDPSGITAALGAKLYKEIVARLLG